MPSATNRLRLGVVLALAMMALLASCTMKRAIVGKWKEVGGEQIVEFFKDGRITATRKETSIEGKYSFVDGKRIKLELGSAPYGKLERPTMIVVLNVALSDGKLVFTDPGGHDSTFERTK
jgi:uncharacterized protein (DUF2147 family)